MWAVICSLCHNRTFSGVREGSLTNDYVTRWGDGTLFQGLRQQYAPSHGTRCLNLCSDYYLHGPNKDDAVPSPGKKKNSVFLSPAFRFPGISKAIPATSRACLLTFVCRRLYRAASVLSSFENRPNIYMQNHNCSAWEGKHPRLGCKIAALLASVIIPEAS